MLPFYEVDVFATKPFLGNPLGVVLHADGLTDALMQRIARWLNLSETVFVEEADATVPRLRIFAPSRELPFAGHPLVGAGRVLEAAGIVDSADGRFRVRCGRGPVDIRTDAERVWASVDAPARIDTDIDAAEVASALGSTSEAVSGPMVFDVGARWLVVRLTDERTLANLAPSMAAVEGLSHRANLTGITAFAVDDATVHTRSFAPAVGVPEDPICGSGNLCVAAHAAATGLADEMDGAWTARQGQSMGRDGRIDLRIDASNRPEGTTGGSAKDARFTFGGPASIRLEGKLTPGHV